MSGGLRLGLHEDDRWNQVTRCKLVQIGISHVIGRNKLGGDVVQSRFERIDAIGFNMKSFDVAVGNPNLGVIVPDRSYGVCARHIRLLQTVL